MKIKESKFYKPKMYLIADDYDNGKVYINSARKHIYNSESPYSSLLNSILSDSLPYSSDLVIKETHLTDFIKCTDFVCYQYVRSINKVIEKEQCFFHPEMEIFITLTPDISDDNHDMIANALGIRDLLKGKSDNQQVAKGFFKVKAVYYDNQDERHFENIPKFYEKYLEKFMNDEHKISILVAENGEFEVVKHKIKPYQLDLSTMYNDDFLPVHEHIVDALKHSKKGVVLLHGLAGTGKTNYIKWLTSQVSEKEFIFVPTTMIHRLTDPSFIKVLMENKKAVLVLEDCENYISERTVNNPHTDVVASILNIADGILSDIIECQMICTFNASIDKIDTALLRRGRLIAEYCFKALSVEKANAYFQSIDSDSHTDKPLTLAEMIHIKEQDFREKETDKPKFGFI